MSMGPLYQKRVHIRNFKDGVFGTEIGVLSGGRGTGHKIERFWTGAKKTIERFVERAIRLYEQEPGEACASSRFGVYVRRWVGWAKAGCKYHEANFGQCSRPYETLAERAIIC